MVLSARQTVINKLVNLRMTGDLLIGERHQPRAQIANRRHIEGFTQFRRTAAGIERRHQMNGVMGVGFERTAEGVKCRTATEKQETRPKLRGTPITPDPKTIGNTYGAAYQKIGHRLIFVGSS